MPRGTAKKDVKYRNQNATSTNSQNAVALLKADHRKVEELFEQYRTAETPEEQQWTVRQLCKDLIVHTRLEEEIFYPACREVGVDDEMLNEAQVEHDGAMTLIAELIKTWPDDQFFDAKIKVLSNYIEHHVGEEERPRTGIFAKAQKAEIDMSDLGQQIEDRRQQLVAATRRSDYRDRDEYGRFMSEDEYQGRGPDHPGRGYAPRANYRERDEDRFMNEGSRDRTSRGRDYDEDDDYRGPRGHGGWHGDPEGHSEASERGWQHRSRGGYSSRSRDYDEDDDRRLRERGGWHPEGHSEASERGWEHRSRGVYSSGGRDYDDDDDHHHRSHSSRSRRGHGGWFGDPERHSDAARRGRDDR